MKNNETNSEINLNLKEPDLFTNEEIAALLPLFADVKEWIKKVEDYALSEALKGNKIPGYKVVEGRSISRYVNQGAVLDRLKQIGYSEQAVFFKPRELVSVSDMKRIIKKDFEKIEDLVEKPKGKPTLVEANDKRPEYSSENDVKAELFGIDDLVI